jgi:hypothetical protein
MTPGAGTMRPSRPAMLRPASGYVSNDVRTLASDRGV